MAEKKTLLAAAASVAAVTAAATVATAAHGPGRASAGRVAATQAAPDVEGRYPHGLRHEAVTRGAHRPAKARRLSAGKGVKVAFTVLDRNGRAPADPTSVDLYPLNGDDPFYAEVRDGRVEGEVPAGRYAVLSRIATAGPGGTTSTALVYRPEVDVTKAAAVVLDAREARPIAATVDRAGAGLVDGEVRVVQEIAGAPVVTSQMMGLKNAYVTPTGRVPGLSFDLQGVFTRGGAESGSPYVYNAVVRHPGGVPRKPGLRVRTRDMAAVRTVYGTEGRPACVGGHATPAWPDSGSQIGFFTGVGAAPATRTEYYSPGVGWNLDWMNTTADCGFGFETTEVWQRDERFPKPGPVQRRLTPAPFGPREGLVIWGETGDGGEPALTIGMHSTADGASYMAPYAGATGTSVLRDAGGRIVHTYGQPGAAWNWPAPKPGDYTLTVDEKRAAPQSPLAVRQHAVWHFTVRDDQAIPLPSLAYRTALDASARAKAGARQRITVTTGRTGAARPRLWASSDDGRTWKAVAVTRAGKAAWTGTVTNPRAGFVSLRASVPGVLDQTVIRAYAIRG